MEKKHSPENKYRYIPKRVKIRAHANSISTVKMHLLTRAYKIENGTLSNVIVAAKVIKRCVDGSHMKD